MASERKKLMAKKTVMMSVKNNKATKSSTKGNVKKGC